MTPQTLDQVRAALSIAALNLEQAYYPDSAQKCREALAALDAADAGDELQPSRERVLRDALERSQGCINGLLKRTPVRDVSETLAEIEHALTIAAPSPPK